MITKSGLKKLGANLRAARSKCSLSQKDVSDDIYITQPSLSKYEKGHREPLSSTLFALASCYGVSVESLFQGVEFQDRAA